VLIMRRSYCINIASDLVLSVSDGPVCDTGLSLTENTIPDAILIQFDLMMSIELLDTCR